MLTDDWNIRDLWNFRYKHWPELWKEFQKNNRTQWDFLDFIAEENGFTVPQAYIATGFMFRPKENYN
jgi:hypothetical protein